MLSEYLSKYSFRNQLIGIQPEDNTGIIVVIPAHDEESILLPLKSLQQCQFPKQKVEVIVVFNAAEKDETAIKDCNHSALKEAKTWYNSLSSAQFQLYLIIENNLPNKHAGVGLARKIGMDEATRRFEYLGNEEGIIVCFDADSQCYNNYLIEIERHFEQNPNSAAASIYFEHPLTGEEFSKEVYKGIYYYELHLRYYKNGLAYANLPYAYHTIGSSMAVRVKDYCKQGGMNRRKAGEDFYFLQKFANVGTLYALNKTTVIPSPRASHRVPFGTGRAIQEMMEEKREITKSYNFQTFEVIRKSFEEVGTWYELEPNFHPMLIEFVGKETLARKLQEIRHQSTTVNRFKKRFFQWFDAFMCLKFVHFLRDNYFNLVELELEVPQLLKAMGINIKGDNDLEKLRCLDRIN